MARELDDTTIFDRLYLESDDYVVPNDFNTLPDMPEGTLIFDALEDFSDALRAHFGRYPSLEPTQVQQKINHEAAHALAAKAAGFSIVVYGLSIVKDVNGYPRKSRFHVSPLLPERDITKLALASIAAAPAKPSGKDLSALGLMGYSGVQDVAERVIEHNKLSPDLALRLPSGVFESFLAN